MALLALVPLVFGWLAARRLLGERDPLAAATLAFSLAVSLTVLGVNGIYRVSTLPVAILCTLGAMAAASALMVWKGRREPLQPTPLRPATGAVLVLATLAVYLFANSQQIANPDDDYWIHTPLQGLMLHGSFPPTNPFFSDLPMNGHYGRNLSLVTVAWLTGLDLPLVQTACTDLYQVVTFLLLFVTLHRFTGSQLQALLGAGFVFFGVNVGGRGGLMDTLQNNNALVHLDLALILHLVLRTWAGSAWAAGLGGLALGGYAIVYETHFGLVVLALFATVPLLLLLEARNGPERLGRRGVLLTLGLLAVAFPLAVTQGGPLTEMFQRRVLHRTEVDVARLSKGLQNQAQVVKLQVPKENLFQILLEEGEYQRISYAYRTQTFLQRLYSPSKERGYRPIWSWDVLKIHWLALLLAPLTLAGLLRYKNRPGLLLFAFGAISFLTPALVDFGPIYESEYFRWQFAAGVGLAGALGLAAGGAFEEYWRRHPGVAWTWDATKGDLTLRFGPRGLACLALGLLVWLNTVSCGEFLLNRLGEVHTRGWLRHGLLLPDTAAWLQRHAVLDFYPADLEAAAWLEARVRPGDRMLSNFVEENNFSILNESTLSGLSGARSVGHALPLDDEAIGTTAYHMAPPARAFWATLDSGLLRGLQVDWLYVRDERGLERRLSSVPGLKLEKAFADSSGQRRLVYRVDLPDLAVGPVREGRSSLEVADLRLPRDMRNARGVTARLTLVNRGPGTARAEVLFYETVRKKTSKRTAAVERILQPVDLTLAPGERRTLEVPFATPLEDGDYALEFFAGDAGGVQRLGGKDLSFTMDFRPRLSGLKLAALRPLDPLRAGRLVRCHVVLENPGGQALEVDGGMLAALAAARAGGDGTYARTAGQNLVPVEFSVPAGGGVSLVLPLVAPDEPGSYRLDVGLAPAEGGLFLLEGPVMEVAP